MPGFFTHGISFELPHPSIPKRTLLLVERVFIAAWTLLHDYPPPEFKLQDADEDSITTRLVGIIESRLRKRGEILGFDARSFGRVTRDAKIPNYNFKHPDKMPDIFFDLKREGLPILSEQDGLFVECKPINPNKSIGKYYCDRGMQRFVNGDYAWAMQEGMMLAYVKDFSDVRMKLIKALNRKSVELNLTFIEEDEALTIVSGDSELNVSTHLRRFDWLEKRGKAVNIVIYHLFLKVVDY